MSSTEDDNNNSPIIDSLSHWPFLVERGSNHVSDCSVISTHSLGTLYNVQLPHHGNRDPNNKGTTTDRKDKEYHYSNPLLLIPPPANQDTTEKSVVSLLYWHRFKVWWMKPNFVATSIPQFDKNDLPTVVEPRPETLAILFRDVDRPKLFRFMIIGNDCSSLRGITAKNAAGNPNERGGIHIQIDSRTNSDTAPLYCGISDNPYALIQQGLEVIGWRNTIQPSSDNHNLQDFTIRDQLGWCTWNAFYTQVDAPALVEAVQSFTQQQKHEQEDVKRTKIPIQWMILDDGWQHTTNDQAQNGQQWSERLASFRESPDKFQRLSLKDTVRQIKQLGVAKVWVWHTLAGYWLGVDPTFFADYDPKHYFPVFSRGIRENDPSTEKEASVDYGIIVPTNADNFFDDYHSYLKECGVDGVKVDAQGVIGTIRMRDDDDDDDDDDDTTSDLVKNLHTALGKSVCKHFNCSPAAVPIIHCMAHAPEIFRQISRRYPGSPFLRASDDHYPNNPSSHEAHIVACSYNSLLLSHFSIPDWDMFTTNLHDNSHVRLHAISRCLSGGPVYISDPPQSFRPDVINWICCMDGSTLPCCEAATPIIDCLLTDPLAVDSNPLVICNVNGSNKTITSGVFGIFHLAGGGKWDYNKLDYTVAHQDQDEHKYPLRKTVSVRARDVVQWKHVSSEVASKFLAIPFTEPWAKAKVLDSESAAFKIDLEPGECEAVSIIPLHQLRGYEIALLGIVGVINCGGSIVKTTVNDQSITASVRGCGTFYVAIKCMENPVNAVKSKNIQVTMGNNDSVPFLICSGMLGQELSFDLLQFCLEPSKEMVQKVTVSLTANKHKH